MSFLYMITIYPLELIYKYIYLACVSCLGSYGFSLITMSLLTFVVFVPLKKWAKKISDNERDIQDVLAPQIAKIKSEATGAERQKRISNLFKRYSYNPVFAVRSALGAGLQIPFLMAAYYMISGLKVLEGQSFLFVKDLSQSDGLLFGLNLLPVLMTLINFTTAFTAKDMRSKDKVQAVVIAILFLMLLYTAPSALLIYWTCNNVLYLLENIKTVKNAFDKSIDRFYKVIFKILKTLYDFIQNHLTELVLSATIGLFVPVNLYIQNNTEFNFELSQVLGYFILVTVCLFVCLSFISVLFNKLNLNKTNKNYKLILVGLLFGFFIQSYLINVNYGVLDGREIDWSKYKSVGIWNTIVWCACLVVPFVLFKKVNMKKVVAGILSLEVLFLGHLFYSTPILPKLKYFASEKGMFEVSKNKNIIVFMLDTFTSSVFKELLEKKPELYKKFSDFTYYPDIVGSYPTTAGAMPFILTQKWYKNEKMYRDYIHDAWKNNPFYKTLRENNFDVRFYGKNIFIDEVTDIDNKKEGKVELEKRNYFIKNWYLFVNFKILPHFFKKLFLIETSEITNNFSFKIGNSIKEASEDNFSFIKNIKSNDFSLIDKNVFKLHELRGLHPPFEMAKDFNRIDKVSEMECAEGNINMVLLYIDKLKKSNQYNHSEIVILADHGYVAGSNFHLRNPLYLMKKVNDKFSSLKISSKRVSYENLHATWLDGADIKNYHMVGIPFEKGETKERKYLNYSWDDRWRNMLYLPTMTEYLVIGKVNVKNSWRKTGCVYEDPVKKKSFTSLKVGQVINFSRKDILPFLIDGFSGIEKWGIWTDGKEAVLKMRVKKGKGKNLILNLTAQPYLGKSLKEQVVIVLANEQQVAEWYVNRKDIYKAEIPASVMTTDELKLKFVILNSLSPASEGGSFDTRNLGIGIVNMVIEELPRINYNVKKVKLGKTISFVKDGNGKKYIESGFSRSEFWGIWTDGKEAVLKMRVKKGKGKSLVLNLTVQPYLGKSLKEQVVAVLANGQQVAEWHVDKKDIYKAEIPSSVMAIDELKLIFKISNPISPKLDGISLDSRNLGIGFINLDVKEK